MNEIMINGVKYVPENNLSVDGMKPVLIRSFAAGVHFGYLKSEQFTPSGKVVVLSNTRRVWYWSGAASLSQMANEGVKNPKDCNFSVIVAENEIVNVLETIPLTEIALKNLYEVPIWKN
jgi:hypothetical protein